MKLANSVYIYVNSGMSTWSWSQSVGHMIYWVWFRCVLNYYYIFRYIMYSMSHDVMWGESGMSWPYQHTVRCEFEMSIIYATRTNMKADLIDDEVNCRSSFLLHLSILGEKNVSRYITESITTDCRKFQQCMPCQLCTKHFACSWQRPTWLKHFAKQMCFLYISAHSQFSH